MSDGDKKIVIEERESTAYGRRTRVVALIIAAVLFGMVAGALLWYFTYELPRRRRAEGLQAVVPGAKLAGGVTPPTAPSANSDFACGQACRGQTGALGWTRNVTSGACACWNAPVTETVWMTPDVDWSSGFYASA